MTATRQRNERNGIPLPSVLRRHPVPSGLIALLVIALAVAVVVFVVRRDAGPERGGQAAPVDTSTWKAPPCDGGERTVVAATSPGIVLTDQWEEPSPPDDVTYDLTGVTSTAYPASHSVGVRGRR
jgi:hypothetical protein